MTQINRNAFLWRQRMRCAGENTLSVRFGRAAWICVTSVLIQGKEFASFIRRIALYIWGFVFLMSCGNFVLSDKPFSIAVEPAMVFSRSGFYLFFYKGGMEKTE